MIVPDANLILYAYNNATAEHKAAREWWESLLNATETVGLSWRVVTAFLRIGTNKQAFVTPLSAAEAVEIIQSWLERPMVQLIVPSARHWPILAQLMVDAQVTGPLVMDAHLAALAIEYGAVLHSHDLDFKRFDGLKLFDPLRV